MRLLNARTIVVEDFSAKQVPPYAILSHTWEDGEVTLQDMERQTASAKAGYAKIRDSCEQTLRDKLEYIWVDTCCIDKTSSAELSEAINAMFRWYQDSTMCYAFLSDVPSDTNFDESSPFATSRWFTRGWTLQELLAPAKLDFYSNSWDHLGSKADLAKAISSIARIDEAFLRGRPIREASIAARMSWAARRETSREREKKTYLTVCLVSSMYTFLCSMVKEGITLSAGCKRNSFGKATTSRSLRGIRSIQPQRPLSAILKRRVRTRQYSRSPQPSFGIAAAL
ncbi:het domain protein [Colletotrichum camelliae]|nr:het domain protein [Colletotrichum camelliae]